MGDEYQRLANRQAEAGASDDYLESEHARLRDIDAAKREQDKRGLAVEDLGLELLEVKCAEACAVQMIAGAVRQVVEVPAFQLRNILAEHRALLAIAQAAGPALDKFGDSYPVRLSDLTDAYEAWEVQWKHKVTL